MAVRDLTGQHFGRLTAIKIDPDKVGKKGDKYWICKCDCGNIKSIRGCNLTSGGSQSCGCLHKEKISNDIIGQRFGKLVVLRDSGKRTSSRGKIYSCQCDCGKICEIARNSLIQKSTKSCGCFKGSAAEEEIEELLKKNNIPYEREYKFSNCYNPKTNYPLKFDFYIDNKYLLEYDGKQHFEATGAWSTKEHLKKLENEIR